MTIRLLPSVLVNRIAAGEVIERPAAAVKELVENALDAGASAIEVTLIEAGVKLISVRDNGSGIRAEELPLAIERHATSKLKNDDLLNIYTLGFRGEALPSIGAVSRLKIISRTAQADSAWGIRVDAGEKSEVFPCGAPLGTEVEVQDLFYATPARLKFLKTAQTELNHTIEVVEKLALAYPHISFSLSTEKKKIFETHGGQGELFSIRLQRLAQVLGKDFESNALPLEIEKEGVQLSGLVGVPTYNRPNASQQYFFVNDRPVRDKLLLGSVKAAYQDVLAHDRYPVVALFLSLSPELVDVNVHPTKAEVRFRESGFIRNLIVSGIRQSLAASGCRTSTLLHQAAIKSFQVPKNDQGNFFQRAQAQGLGRKTTPQYIVPQTKPRIEMSPAFSPDSMVRATLPPLPEMGLAEESPSVLQQPEFPLGIAKAQLHETYILAQTRDGLAIVDQHAVHERLVYEKIKQELASDGVKREALLIPEVVELPLNQIKIILEKEEFLKQLGLSIEPFGELCVLLREVPSLLKGTDFKALLQDIGAEIQEQEDSMALSEKIMEKLSTFACHSSIRAGRNLSFAEMDALLRQMEQVSFSSQCNHGRPTYIELKLDQIEKLFGRK